MFGSRTTRALPAVVRRIASSRRPYPLRATTRLHSEHSAHSFSACSSLPLRLNREEKRRDVALPTISLQHPLSLPGRQFSSATASDKKDESFRERMEGRKEQGLLAFASGKDLAKKYGPVFAGTYLAVYVGTLGLLFAGIESGVMEPSSVLSMVTENADEAKSTVQVITDFMSEYSVTRPWVPAIERNPQAANFAVAWIATKFTEPIRLVVSAAIVPTIARTLGYVEKKEDDIEEQDTPQSAEKEKKNSSS